MVDNSGVGPIAFELFDISDLRRNLLTFILFK